MNQGQKAGVIFLIVLVLLVITLMIFSQVRQAEEGKGLPSASPSDMKTPSMESESVDVSVSEVFENETRSSDEEFSALEEEISDMEEFDFEEDVSDMEKDMDFMFNE